MKKFFAAMMFALIVVFQSPSNVSAFYADGYHYFCVAIDGIGSGAGNWDDAYTANVYVLRNGVQVSGMTIQFGRNGDTWYYHVMNKSTGFAPVSSNRIAQLVFEETCENVLYSSRRKTPKTDAAELEKRREEEPRRNEFNRMIAAGDKTYTAGDYPAAVQNYESARKLDKASVDKFIGELLKNGDNLTSQENYPAAIDYYKKAVVMNLSDSVARKKLWHSYKSSKNFSDAANFYRTMTTIKPDNDYYWFNLGYSLNELKDYDGSIAAYTRSAELDPKDHVTYNNRGNVYKNSWRYDEAIAAYKKALEIKPDYKLALDNLWDAYYKSGKFDDAIDFYKPRVDSDIKGWDASKHLWEAYLITKKFDDAVDFYRTRINNKRYFGDDLFKLGWSLNEQKKFPEAIKAMKKYIEFRNAADSWYWLARVYQNAGDTKKAVDACKKALKLNPKYADAKNLLARLTGGK